MQRDPARLARGSYDVVVVGGGIHGACVAWEAALNGLKVALIDAGDFGNATSGNSLRTLHGGLRHLQRLDFARMRESVRARREWLRLAPHLARPLRFVLPTYGHGIRGPVAMRAALCVSDLMSLDRNHGVAANRHIPPSSVWSRQLARAVLTGTRTQGCNGAATWFDAVCASTERLLIAVVSAAVRCGARASNYVCATGLTMQDGAVCAVRVRDALTGRESEIRTRCVVDAAGSSVGEWSRYAHNGASPGGHPLPLFRASRAFNLLTRPLPFKEGVGLSVPRLKGTARGPQTYFILPWNERALIGTRHLRCDHSERSAAVSREEVVDFLDDLNSVLGGHRIAGADVLGVYSGLLPEQMGSAGDDVELARAQQVIDHGAEGAKGLVSVIGVKWTTSHSVARQVVRCVSGYLRRPVRLRADLSPLWSIPPAAARPSRRRWRLEQRSLAHLEEMYGPERGWIFSLLDEDESLADCVVADSPVIKAQIVHAARGEMAVQLADVVMRRTPLYLSESLDGMALRACAMIAARELHWGESEIHAQVARAQSLLQAFRGPFVPQPTLRAVSSLAPQRASLR